nr:hypothetical protein [Mycobacterium malmoense]
MPDSRRSIEEFDRAEHQHPANVGSRNNGWAANSVYVNDFVFIPTAALE